MIDRYPNPWDFSNIDSNLISPDKLFKIEYYNLSEIAMGGPIGGECFLITPNEKIKINDWCAGPISWDASGRKFAIPIWTPNRKQKIAIVNFNDKSITVYSKLFRVLDLRTFNKNIITGYDSPIHHTANLEFDLLTEPIDNVTELI